MKVWTKVQIKDRDPKIDLISKSLTNYIYTYGPINTIRVNIILQRMNI